MEAALISALRGHEVTLFDRASKLGGLMPIAGVVKGFEIEELQNITHYFQAQFKKHGVKVRLKETVDLNTVEKLKPDVVFLAEGGIVYAPDIPGIENKNVITAQELHKKLKKMMKLTSPEKLRKLTNLYLPVGKSAVVIGSGVYGMEVAEFLVKRGRKVTIVDSAPEAGIGMLDYRMGLIMPWFEKKGVPVLTNLKHIKIISKGVVITTAEGETQTIEADSVLPVAQPKPNLGLYKRLQGMVPEVYAVGDCSSPNMIVDAIRTAWAAAKEL
jgi:NADPH-dependent 2,4-dienoyl-CoA reductase/sulfur reductase-like enzyme